MNQGAYLLLFNDSVDVSISIAYPSNKHLVWSFNNKNDKCIEAHFLLVCHDSVGYSISTVYLSNKALGVVIQYEK